MVDRATHVEASRVSRFSVYRYVIHSVGVTFVALRALKHPHHCRMSSSSLVEPAHIGSTMSATYTGQTGWVEQE